MAFPWDFGANFEDGATTGWTTETDTQSWLDVVSYRDLASMAFPAAPYSGAYCLRSQFSGASSTAYLLKSGLSFAASTYGVLRFAVFVGSDVTATVEDKVILVGLRSAAAREGVVGATLATDGTWTLGIGDADISSSGATLEKNTWYNVECLFFVDSGANDGTLDLYVTEEGKADATAVYCTQVTGLTQATITGFRLGTQSVASTSSGTILLDDFVVDSDTSAVRLGVLRRWQRSRRVPSLAATTYEHLFVGPGTIESLTFVAGSNGDQIEIYDTDRAEINNFENCVARFEANTNNFTLNADGPIEVTRGAYLVTTAASSDCETMIRLGRAPYYGSTQNMRRLGLAHP